MRTQSKVQLVYYPRGDMPSQTNLTEFNVLHYEHIRTMSNMSQCHDDDDDDDDNGSKDDNYNNTQVMMRKRTKE